MHSLRPKTMGLAWGSSSVGRSLSRMAVDCGLPPTLPAAQAFVSPCPPRSRPWNKTRGHFPWARLGCGFSPKVIWGVVKEKAKLCEIPALAPHDRRRTCARLCHQAGGELEQIQFLLGHVSVQTTERYLGCKQRFHNAVNDRIGLEPDPPGSL